MEIRVLKYFLMTAREENITRAAALLHITQPTLSRQLMQLEEELGVKLFHRSRHRIILTNDGMLLKRRAEEILSLADKTEREFSQKEENLVGELVIGSGELQSSQFLSMLLASFQKKHPQIYYEIYSGNSDNIKEKIERGVLDLGLLVEPVDITRYEFIRLPVKEEWGILINKDSELVKKKNVTSKDLINIPLIMTKRETLQKELKNWFGIHSEEIEIIASGNLLYNMAIMAKNRIGVVITPKLDCQYDGLSFIPLFPKLESTTVLVWKKNQAFSPVASAFIEYIKKYISGIFNDTN